jgi:preprotein translocase subunit YajC
MKLLRIFIALSCLLFVGVSGAIAQEWQRIHGKVQSVSGNTVTVKADDGRTVTVDASQVDAGIRGALTAGEGVTLIGFKGSDANKFTARYIQQDSSDPSRGGTIVGQTPPPADGKGWQRVHAKVQSVSGNTVTARTDDGRTLTVDASRVSAEIRNALKTGAGVTLVGFAGQQPTQFTAHYIEQDGSAAQSPSASPTGVAQKPPQRIHGTVQSVSGTTLSMKADDGRELNVDMKDVGPGIRQSLRTGDKVLVTGFYRGEHMVSARSVQKAN